MNMVHDMDKEVYKVCSCPRIKSYMHCTHIRKGMWVVGGAVWPYPILYSLKFLREHPHTSQLLFDLFFPKHLLYSVTNSIVALYSISFVSYSRARLSSSIQEVILPEYGL